MKRVKRIVVLIILLAFLPVFSIEITNGNGIYHNENIKITSVEFQQKNEDGYQTLGETFDLVDNADYRLIYTFSGKDEMSGIPAGPFPPYVFELPKDLLGEYEVSEEEIKNQSGEVIATYSVKNASGKKQLFLFVKKNIEAGETISVQFDISMSIEEKRIDVPWLLSIPVSSTETKTYHISIPAPDSFESVSNLGTLNETNKGVDWVVYANTNFSNIGNDLVLTDDMDSRLTFEDADIKIYPIQVEVRKNENGEYYPYYIEETALDAGDFTVTTTGSEYSITIPNGGDKAYKVNIASRRIADKIIPQEEYIYKSSAKLGENSSDAEVVYRPLLALIKSVATEPKINDDYVTWTLGVNKPLFRLPNAVIVESIPMAMDVNVADIIVKDQTGTPIPLTEITEEPSTVPTAPQVLFFEENNQKKFKLFLGDLNQVSRNIIVKTKYIEEKLIEMIKPTSPSDAEMMMKKPLINEAFLSYDWEGTQKNFSPVSAETEMMFGKYILKTSEPDYSYGEDGKYLTWSYYFNLAGRNTGVSILHDMLDQHQVYDLSSLAVYSLLPKIKNDQVEWEETKIAASKYDIQESTNDGQSTFTFTWKDGVIEQPIVIKYRTKVKSGAFNETIFSNTANDSNSDYIFTGTHPIANSFVKKSSGYDDQTKLFGWEIALNPLKEKIEQVVVTDVLPPSMLMTQHLIDDIVIKKEDHVLTKGTDYQVAFSSDNPNKFVVTFNEHLDNGHYMMLYSSKLNDDFFKDSNDQLLNDAVDFTNKAVVAYHIGTQNYESNIQANPTLTDEFRYNGRKYAEPNFSDRLITWYIDVNYASKNMRDLHVSDLFSEQSGMVLKKDSIKVMPLTVSNDNAIPSASLTAEQLLDRSIEVKESNDGESFDIAFEGLVDQAYRISFQTDIIGISKKTYANAAQLTYQDGTFKKYHSTYNAVTEENSNAKKFVTKSGDLKGLVATWEIQLNRSLSDIQNVHIVDTYSPGLLLRKNSFRLNVDGVTSQKVFDEYFTLVQREGLISEEQQFDLIAKKDVVIDKYMTIWYDMEVIPDFLSAGNIYNTVQFSGDQIIDGETQKTVEIPQSIVTSSGYASTKRIHSILLSKQGDDGKILAGVSFEIYKKLSNGTWYMMGIKTTDSKGEILIEKLRQGEYKFHEIQPPAHYTAPTSDTFLTINSDNIVDGKRVPFEVSVVNRVDRAIKIIKVDEHNQPIEKSGIQFDIFKATDKNNKIATVETDSTGVAIWRGENGRYFVKESRAPQGYERSNELKEVVLKDIKDDSGQWITDFDIRFVNKRLGTHQGESHTVSEVTKTPTGETTIYSSETITTDDDTTTIIVHEGINSGKIIKKPTDVVSIAREPEHGTVLLVEEGIWEYIPYGLPKKDSFQLKIIHPDGSNELITIDVDVEVEEVPEGTLPKTGQQNHLVYYMLGMLMASIGIFIQKRL